MAALILDGKALAKTTEEELSARVAALKEKTGKTPILATILVGDDPASATYVKMKGNACARVGMESIRVVMDKNTTTEELLGKIQELNENPNVHGILCSTRFRATLTNEPHSKLLTPARTWTV